MRRPFVIIFLLLNFSCVGVDVFDDPIDLLKGNTIEFLNAENNMLALQVGESFEVEAVYFDQYGIQRDYTLIWQSENDNIASVNGGQIEGQGAGTTTVVVSYLDASKALQVTVVIDASEVASVVVEDPLSTSLNLSEQVQLNAMVLNINGETLSDKTIEWFTENQAIATVSSTGLVKALTNGVVEIHAKSEGVKSNSIIFTIGSSNIRQGSFVPAGGYQARGTATLSNIDGQLILKLSDDFQTSFALGTFIYLANSTTGSQVKAGGFEVAQITTNGTKTFNITNLNSSITIDQYKYVIILCKPASITFGYAELK
jgi:Bacterial Ig-like domain (group 2)/Electron transfer DM13